MVPWSRGDGPAPAATFLLPPPSPPPRPFPRQDGTGHWAAGDADALLGDDEELRLSGSRVVTGNGYHLSVLDLWYVREPEPPEGEED